MEIPVYPEKELSEKAAGMTGEMKLRANSSKWSLIVHDIQVTSPWNLYRFFFLDLSQISIGYKVADQKENECGKCDEYKSLS